MRLVEQWNDNLLTINPNDFLSNFKSYDSRFNLENKLLYLDIPDTFQIKESKSKIPIYGNFMFTSLRYLCPWDNLPVTLNLGIPKDDLLVSFLTKDNVQFAFININCDSLFPLENMKLIIYVDDEIKYIFKVDQYTLDRDFEICCINTTPSDTMVGLLNNIRINERNKYRR